MTPDVTLDFIGFNEYLILIPKKECFGIKEGSAICASSKSGGFIVDYEGNKYKAANLKKYPERMLHAISRQKKLYPTIARLHLSRAELLECFNIAGVVTCVSEISNEDRWWENNADIFPEMKLALEAWSNCE